MYKPPVYAECPVCHVKLKGTIYYFPTAQEVAEEIKKFKKEHEHKEKTNESSNPSSSL